LSGFFVSNSEKVFPVFGDTSDASNNQPLHRHTQQWIHQDRHQEKRDDGSPIPKTLAEFFETQSTKAASRKIFLHYAAPVLSDP
jgi:hypothetical protein